MPRVDNSELEIIAYYGLPFDPSDPGKTPPVDLCRQCRRNWEAKYEIDHPPYEEQNPPYRCLDCGETLKEDDN